MRTLTIRQWMIVGMIIFFATAGTFAHLAGELDRRVRPAPSQGATLDTAQRAITAGVASWGDPAWQASTRGTLAALGVGGVVRDPSGAEIFRIGAQQRGWYPSREVAVVEGGQEVGTLTLFAPTRDGSFAWAATALAVVLAILFVRWQMNRYMIRPLEAMGRAARQIAGGDLNFALPPSRVREVANVRDAFEAMGEGLRGAIARQAALEEERRFFIGAIAHDLRTPLFALRGYLVGLEQGVAASPEKAARYVALCRQRADQLDRLVSDLFAYTRAEYLEQTVHHARLPLGPLLVGAVDGLLPSARAKGVAMTSAEPDEPCAIEGDAQLLQRAVENLLDNALRYTPPGGEIAVRWRAEGARAVFTVADTGPGIAAHDLPHLFDPLYRGEASRNRETGGAGLGLAIARRILRTHGGDLVAANRADGGAEFIGWLPLSPAPSPAKTRETIAVA